ncbi:OmpA family protein [Brevundimonas sp.]|uniref:OmpA family protein n=1 Tax=Brevundimonas sp. TaxID=1871086 RepID=UPI002D5167A6|nr:OmpA family protein [Brevundimonas sp.]HYC69387.1 OmpA family protein [Brevundimonas sp.]
MLDMIVIFAAAALTGAPQQAPDCRTGDVYFESGRANLNVAARQTVDAVHRLALQAGWRSASATITGHVDGDEKAKGLTSLDEERAAAVRGRLEELHAGSPQTLTFATTGVDDSEPARRTSAPQPLNRRVSLSVCAAES